MTAMSFALAKTAAIVGQIEDTVGEVETVNLYVSEPDYMTLTIMTTGDALAPAVAVLLGLTDRRLHEKPHTGSDRYIEAFYGSVDGMFVSTSHLIPLSAMTEAERAERTVTA